MKKALYLILALLLVFSFAACSKGDIPPVNGEEAPGNEIAEENSESDNGEESSEEENDSEASPAAEPETEENNEEEESVVAPVTSSKTLKFFLEYAGEGAYTMEIITEAEGMKVKALTAYKDGMTYSESEYDGVRSCVIIKDGFQYVIDHSSKTCIKLSDMEGAMTELLSESSEYYETPLTTGTTEFNGKSWFYEEFSVEGEKVRYLFDGDILKYMTANVMGMESTVEIVSVKKGADAELFEVREDYQMMSF